MRKKTFSKRMLFAFFVFFFLSFCFLFQTSAHADITIISNNSVTTDSLTKLQIKDISIGSLTTWDDGQEIKLVLLKKSATHKEFTRTYTRKSQSQFKMTWRRIVYTGKGLIPKSFKSENDLVTYVKNTKGAIGYVSSATPFDGVKTITVLDK